MFTAHVKHYLFSNKYLHIPSYNLLRFWDIISAPGEGTAVHIEFPRCCSTISSDDEPESTLQPDLNPKTTLLAEDDPPVLRLIQHVLAEEATG